ncbi:MAG TPA: hypothetical protein VEI97_19395, partial [bacterium]|nr:hypothetical protein [bacterium]
ALLETTGGFGGGTSVTRTLQVRTVLDEGGETAQLAETSGSPLSTPRYLPAIAAGTGRFVVADVFGEDITLIRGTYATDGRIEVGTVGPLDLTTGATAVELAFLGNAFQVLYALPVNPLGSDEFRQNVQVAAAQFPLDPGPAIYFDRPVDRDGDTDSHRTPTVIGGPDGEALAVWVGAVEGRHTWGRLSFNRTH